MILEDIHRCAGCGAWTATMHRTCGPCQARTRQQMTLDRLALAHLRAAPAGATRHRRRAPA